jgi:Acetyltransferases, including N-acetylases of ribosomal proteins
MIDKRPNPYERCPIYETGSFTFRLVQESDAEDLLKCYLASVSAKIFNSDNCTSNFIYHSLDEMKSCIQFGIQSYENQCFIHFSIIDKKTDKAIGTIECFAKEVAFEKNFGRVGVLRIDLASEYETEAMITEILNAINDNFYEIFGAKNIITKAIPEAEQRIGALMKSGYIELKDNPIMPYHSYYIRTIG